MIMVSEYNKGNYVLKLDNPERVIISEIAKGYSISKTDAIAAIINRGMDSIGRQVKQVDTGKTLKQLWQEKAKGGD